VTCRALAIPADDVQRLRDGMTVGVYDSAGAVVCVSMRDRPGDGGPRLTISEAQLALAATPEGLVCGDDTRTTGWTVRVMPGGRHG
jgi:uncharacterized protein YodC (DUF2158 family)